MVLSTLFPWMILAQIILYSPIMLESCEIPNNMIYPMVPKILGIQCQLWYQTQLCESTVVLNYRMSLPIGNVHRLLLFDTPYY